MPPALWQHYSGSAVTHSQYCSFAKISPTAEAVDDGASRL